MIFTSPHLVYCCPTAAKAPGGFLFPYVLQDFLRRARQYSNLRPSLFVVILLQGHRQTWRDSGETKPRFYKGFGIPERTGRDRDRHPIAVRYRMATRST
jgi:hypothetical protein